MISGIFSNFVFLHPWLLAGLGGLPLLWFLLRVTPPAPRLIKFPGTRFLQGLTPEKQTTNHTPWWILLLRLVIAALVIIALAHPVYNPAAGLPNANAIRLVIDNGWASAQTWNGQIEAAKETISKAGRENKNIYILTTAPTPGNTKPASHGPLTAGQAEPILKGLVPLPWPSDYEEATASLVQNKPDESVHSFWYSNGLTEDGFEKLSKTLQSQGGLTYLSPPASKLPLVLKAPKTNDRMLHIRVDGPTSLAKNFPITLQALSEDGKVLDIQTQTLNPENFPTTIRFDIPETLRSNLNMFKIATRAGTGSVFALDERFHKRSIGIVGPAEDAETKPFIEGIYYLKRALEPYAALHLGTIEDNLKNDLSMIILPDIVSMPAETLNTLENWVRDGNLLLRFAGPKMAEAKGDMFLTPVPIRAGGRSLQGSLTWDEPQKLMKFPETSPFYGITLHENITVNRQILAEPISGLEEKTWAELEDGTPLITAAPLGKGLLVMVHTTASPAWSDLALSGVFVEVLKRLVSLSGSTQRKQIQTDSFLNPLWVFDGFGAIKAPENWVRPISAEKLENTRPSSTHPPGIYGRGNGYQQALNIGDHVGALKTPESFPIGVQTKIYGGDYERDLMNFILYAALMLLLLDWLIIIILMAGLKPLTRFTGIALIFMVVLRPAGAHAENDVIYADGLYLAYIKTGDPGLDSTSRQGLENLAAVLKRRTSVEPDGVAALNPEYDTLVFFPLIYWPIGNAPNHLSHKALNNIQHYLDHGGTILFDTRDQNYAASPLTGTKNSKALRDMTGALNIPPLKPLNKDHVLGRSFYLIDSFPGHYTGGTLWVEENSASGRDGVSSVIIGSHDWATAWASEHTAHSALSGGSRQQEMAYRFGVNLAIYALTGNYKSDQVHLPHILERLGQ